MEYNTTRTNLVIPEYGRVIQALVERCKKLPTKEERNAMAEGIVEFMRQRNSLLQDEKNYQHKLWDHLFIMANYELDVDTPQPVITQAELKQAPKRMDYPVMDYEYKFYGKSIRSLIDAAIAMADGEEKNALIMSIANNMKKSYNIYNKEYVQDEVILRHLNDLAKGKLDLSEISTLAKNQDYPDNSAKQGQYKNNYKSYKTQNYKAKPSSNNYKTFSKNKDQNNDQKGQFSAHGQNNQHKLRNNKFNNHKK
jgi:Domain of unknown function (DUF4290)